MRRKTWPQSGGWAKLLRRSMAMQARVVRQAMREPQRKHAPKAAQPSNASKAAGAGRWLPGRALAAGGSRRYWLYQPPQLQPGERLPLLVMLHGCGQSAEAFALSTRMNQLAARERCFVLYPEQDRRANAQACWNWFATRSGRADGELALIMQALDQVLARHPIEACCVAVAGLSAGASMAALLVSRHPERFRALAMHSGVAPGAAHSTLTALAAMRGHSASRPVLPASPSDWPPLLVLQGGRDRVVVASNGRAAAELWADAAGAVAGPVRRLQRGQRHAGELIEFRRHGHLAATLVEIALLGHAWSGGAASQDFGDALGPDASRMVWAFANRQFRAARRHPAFA
ncbi:extracellular catalytic domain type 1 short-chain-length polyhydroxyalkanoate depolymerase [Paucibacter soli]|uniref:extracellular catalytic domain type 1 short-chain-length polyhydroxyalkanoate depolymerase n=1 Tax=Paucibacter soli TaxID=3133433 RepID=UPI0030A9369B